MTYTQVPSLTCNILDFELMEGKLTGPIFLRFVQTPQPRLKRLHLNSVTGLANKDLLAFLSIIASTLEELQIDLFSRSQIAPTNNLRGICDRPRDATSCFFKENRAFRRPSHS